MGNFNSFCEPFVGVSPKVLCKRFEIFENLQQTLRINDQIEPEVTKKPQTMVTKPTNTPTSGLKILAVSLLTKALIVNILEYRNRK